MKKKILFIVCLAMMQTALFGQVASDSIYKTPTINATFVGGDSARMVYVKNNLKIMDLPADHVKNTAYVQFVVEKSGVVTNPKILKGISPSIDDEMLRMVQSMPSWIPAQQEGQNVRSQVVLPIKIRNPISVVVIDSAYFNKDWKRTNADSAVFYRIRKKNGAVFNIDYFKMNGSLIEQGEYSSISPEKKNGSFIVYYENGVKSSEYVMVNDTIQGESTDYFPNGIVRLKQNYYNNLKHGDFYEYLENGQLNYIRTYNYGKLIKVSDGKEKDKMGAVAVDEYTVVEEAPEFPGGDEARMEFLMKNLHYPRDARENGISGTVYAQFVIELDGSILNPIIIKDIGGGCGEEVLRIIKLMPKWVPGKQRGKPVRTQFIFPVKFFLD